MAAYSTPIAMQGKNPGEIYIPALQRSFQQIELREDDVHDTEDIPSGAIAADTKFQLFQAISDKNEQHTSLKQPRKIPAGDEAAIFRIGFHVRGATGNARASFSDIQKVIENGVLQVKFNRRIITEGPAIKYQSGYGLGGYSDESGATAVSVGVASAAAAPTLFVPQQLMDNDDLNGMLFFPSAGWLPSGFSYVVPTLGAALTFSVFMRAVLKSPLGK